MNQQKNSKNLTAAQPVGQSKNVKLQARVDKVRKMTSLRTGQQMPSSSSGSRSVRINTNSTQNKKNSSPIQTTQSSQLLQQQTSTGVDNEASPALKIQIDEEPINDPMIPSPRFSPNRMSKPVASQGDQNSNINSTCALNEAFMSKSNSQNALIQDLGAEEEKDLESMNGPMLSLTRFKPILVINQNNEEDKIGSNNVSRDENSLLVSPQPVKINHRNTTKIIKGFFKGPHDHSKRERLITGDEANVQEKLSLIQSVHDLENSSSNNDDIRIPITGDIRSMALQKHQSMQPIKAKVKTTTLILSDDYVSIQDNTVKNCSEVELRDSTPPNFEIQNKKKVLKTSEVKLAPQNLTQNLPFERAFSFRNVQKNTKVQKLNSSPSQERVELQQKRDYFFTSQTSEQMSFKTITQSKASSASTPCENRISDIEQLQQNLKDNEPCIIKQGERTYNVNPDTIKKIFQILGQNEEPKFSPATHLNEDRLPKLDNGTSNNEETLYQMTFIDEGATPKLDIRTSIVPELNPAQMFDPAAKQPSQNSLESPNQISFMGQDNSKILIPQTERQDSTISASLINKREEPANQNLSGSNSKLNDFTETAQQFIEVPSHISRIESVKTPQSIAPMQVNILSQPKSNQTSEYNNNLKTPFLTPGDNAQGGSRNRDKEHCTLTLTEPFVTEHRDIEVLSDDINQPADFNPARNSLSNIQRPSIISANNSVLFDDFHKNEISTEKPASQNNDFEQKPNDVIGQEEEDEYEILMKQMQGEIENCDEVPLFKPSAPALEHKKLVQTLLVPAPREKPSIYPVSELLPVPTHNSRNKDALVQSRYSYQEKISTPFSKSQKSSKKYQKKDSDNNHSDESFIQKSQTTITDNEDRQTMPEDQIQIDRTNSVPFIYEYDVQSQLRPIDEAQSSHENNSKHNGADESYINSQYTSHIINLPKVKLSKNSTEFTSGEIRPRNLKLRYLEMNGNNQCTPYKDFEQPTQTGNPLIDRISMFAYGHGVDPKIFSGQDQDEALQLIEQLKDSLLQEQTRKKGKSSLQNQHLSSQSVPQIISQELVEIRRLLHDQPFEHDFVEENKGTMEFIGYKGARDRRSSSKSTKNSHQTGLSKSEQDLILKILKQETIDNKCKIAVLGLSLNRHLNLDRQKVDQINLQIRVLAQHEKKVQEIMETFRIFKKELHFAFLFASPLIFQRSDHKITYFQALDFAKEFIKIRHSIEAAQVQINITKRQCTTDSIQDVLAQKPLGLHFSGHGLLNNKDLGQEFYEKNMGQGDFLVLENDKGGSELVSREQLRKMIKQNKCELEFVFVATCHSEFVGHIFQEAGAKHVICIKQQNMVQDAAVITFTDTFYSMLFEQNKDICTAFAQAQLSVEISFSQDEAEIFQLLLREDQSGVVNHSSDAVRVGGHDSTEKKKSSKADRMTKLHICQPFGPFQKGRYNYVNHQIVHLQNKAPKMPNLKGRQKDMSKLIEKLLNNKNSRLFNLIGWPGMGKSALVASMLDYIADRGLLKGGSIYFNARNISMCELFIRNFNQVLLSENPTLFGIAKERDQMKSEPVKTLQAILAKISIIDGDIVLVIDNAEELIVNERSDFSMLISMMLTRVSQLKILLTSQRSLQHTREFKEDQQILGNLSNGQSVNLFKEVMARELDQGEINDLLNTIPDLEKYPDEKHKLPYVQLQDHHLFTLLNGIPQSIILVASLLADPKKKLTLKQIYQMLTDAQLFKVLEQDGIEETNLVSLRLSAGLSFQAIEDSDPENIDLLNLLALLPGGIRPSDLDHLWSKVTKQNRKFLNEYKGHHSVAGEASFAGSAQKHHQQHQKQQQDSHTKQAWRRAFAELQKGNLALEKVAAKRSFNTNDEQNLKKIKSKSFGGDSSDEEGDENENDVVVILPEIVRNFSEGKETPEKSSFFLEILSEWYYSLLHQIYKKNDNIVFSAQRASKQKCTVSRDFESLEENLNIFLIRMQEKYQETKYQETEFRRDKRKQFLPDETSDTSSLTDQSDEEAQGLAEKMFSTSSENLASLTAFDTFRESAAQVTRMAIKDIEIKTNFPELLDAYKDVNMKRPILARYIEQMKPRRMMHPKFIIDRDEKAQKYWKWAFERVRAKQKEQKRKEFQKANIKIEEKQNLNESFDSDQSDNGEINMTINNIQKETNKMELTRRLSRIGTRKKLKEQLTTQQASIPMNFQRGSIKTQNHQYARQTSRMSVYEQRRLTQSAGERGDLIIDEKTMIYYLVNLILLKQFNVANSLIKKHFLPMKKCSVIFKANVRRMQALSICRMFQNEDTLRKQKHVSSQEKQARSQKIDHCLKRAYKQFKRADCAWGIGLTYFQQAYMKVVQIEQGFAMKKGPNSSPLVRINRVQSDRKCENFSSINLMGPLLQAKNLFKKAIKHFKSINHWRGLYNSYRHLEKLNLLESELPGESFERTTKEEEERKDFNEQYKKYLNFYDQERYKESDFTIQRNGGEDLSLMTEIVVWKQNCMLFEAQNSSNSSFHTDKDLSYISENQSEIESGVQSVPHISITRFESNEDNKGSLDANTSPNNEDAMDNGNFTGQVKKTYLFKNQVSLNTPQGNTTQKSHLLLPTGSTKTKRQQDQEKETSSKQANHFIRRNNIIMKK